MQQLVLYTTSHCHLCEQAEILLKSLAQMYAIEWQLQEISDDENLIAQYGIKIPVIKRLDNELELNWPFTQNDIVSFIKA